MAPFRVKYTKLVEQQSGPRCEHYRQLDGLQQDQAARYISKLISLGYKGEIISLATGTRIRFLPESEVEWDENAEPC